MLYVECLPDEALARQLGLPKRALSHELNKDEVLKRIFEVSDSLGMVDEDPNSRLPVQFGMMLKLEDFQQWDIALYTISRRGNQVIVLCPDLESWLLKTAELARIRISDPPYNLPSNRKSLHKIINDRLDKVNLLVADLLTAQSPRILKLRQLLTQ